MKKRKPEPGTAEYAPNKVTPAPQPWEDDPASCYTATGSHQMPEDDPVKRIPINQLHQEPGAHELATSPDMEPYLNFAVALMQGADPTAELEAIRQLPLEKRYVWRVASALKWGLADFDDLGVDADRQTLSREDFAKVMDLLKLRPIQFCIFLKALVGTEEMLRMMVEAIKVAKQRSNCSWTVLM